MNEMKKVGDSSRWGSIQHVENLAEGVQCVMTSSHGGFVLSRERVRQMPKHLRLGLRTQFEEDCEAFLVIEAFPQLFAADVVARAKKSNRHWYPGLFEEE